MAKTKKPRLGRGLSSLISKPVSVSPPPPGPAEPQEKNHQEKPAQPAPSSTEAAPETVSKANAGSEVGSEGLIWVKLDQIGPNPHQPRRTFDESELGQLAATIKRDGLMQPVVLRAAGEGFELVAGERRWRASRIAELETIPAIVRDLDEQQMAEWAVIENIQRKDLNAIERAEAFERLVNRFSLSHQDVAERVGSDRTTITNTMRLLDLHEEVREMVRLGHLSGGHGRALLGLQDEEAQKLLARQVVSGQWSVRKTEQVVRDMLNPSAAKSQRVSRATHLSDLEKQIGSQLGTKVRLKRGSKKGTGTLMIEFFDMDQFDHLLDRLGVKVD